LAFISHTTTQAAEPQISVILNDNAVIFEDVQPMIINDRTMIPLRGVFEDMGFSVVWDSPTATAAISNDSTTILVRENVDFITVNNEQVFGDVSPFIHNGWFMLPLRLVAESTGATVDWNAETNSVVISIDDTAVEILTATIEFVEHLGEPNFINLHIQNNADVPVFIDDNNVSWFDFFDGTRWDRLQISTDFLIPQTLVLVAIQPNSTHTILHAPIDTFFHLRGSGLYRIRRGYALTPAELAIPRFEVIVEFYLEVDE